jgi:hypothetical protein
MDLSWGSPGLQEEEEEREVAGMVLQKARGCF